MKKNGFVSPFRLRNTANRTQSKCSPMKIISICLAAVATLVCLEAKAQQLSFKTSYLGKSGYYYLPPGEQPKVSITDVTGPVISVITGQ